MMTSPYSERDPRYYSTQACDKLEALVRHLREGVGNVRDPRAEALFETSTEVLIGLQTAFEHYEQKAEEAWRSQ